MKQPIFRITCILLGLSLFMACDSSTPENDLKSGTAELSVKGAVNATVNGEARWWVDEDSVLSFTIVSNEHQVFISGGPFDGTRQYSLGLSGFHSTYSFLGSDPSVFVSQGGTLSVTSFDEVEELSGSLSFSGKSGEGGVVSVSATYNASPTEFSPGN